MTPATKHIVALGGGGWSIETDNPLLDNYIFNLVKKRKKRVCFVPTASGDSPIYIERFYNAMKQRKDIVPTHLQLFWLESDPREVLLKQDVIYVGGGNTANMLAVWRLHGVDKILRRAWNAGIVLTGVSAGMNCWFQACSTDSFGPLAPLNDGLGFLPGSACPHFDGEIERRPSLHKFVMKGLPSCHAADDGAAFHFIGNRLHKCIASRPRAGCYLVTRVGRKIVEEKLAVEYLS